MKTDRIVIVQGSETGFRVTVMDGALKVLATDPPEILPPPQAIPPGEPANPVPYQPSEPGEPAIPGPGSMFNNPLAAIKRLKNINTQLGQLESTFTESIAMKMNPSPKILIPNPVDDQIVGKWSLGLESVREAMLDIRFLISELTASLPPESGSTTEAV